MVGALFVILVVITTLVHDMAVKKDDDEVRIISTWMKWVFVVVGSIINWSMADHLFWKVVWQAAILLWLFAHFFVVGRHEEPHEHQDKWDVPLR